MKGILSVELKKGLGDIFFVASLGLGAVLAIVGAFQVLNDYIYSDMSILSRIEMLEEAGVTSDVYLGSQTLYNSWIGGNRYSLGSVLFFYLTPILAALPCGWRFFEELNSGYLHMIASRCGRLPYAASKMISAFVSGGLALMLPQVLSVIIIALFIPAIRPDPLYAQYFGITYQTVFSSLYYTKPLIAVVAVIFISFVFGGLFAWLSLTTSFFLRSRTATLVVPFLMLTCAGMCQSFFSYITNLSIAPMDMIHPFSANNIVTGGGILVWIAILLVVTLPVVLIRGSRYEIF